MVRNFVNALLASDSSAGVLVGGDLNVFEFGEPGEGTDHTLAILEGTPNEVPLKNLILLESTEDRFSFVFDGNSQLLDHILVTPSLLQRHVATDILHFNSGYADVFGDDAETSIRSADHDAVEARFRFN